MKQVGSILGLTARTVAYHKYNLRQSLALYVDSDLVRLAVVEHIIPG